MVAGGAATRYGGSPKGLFEVGGRRILDRAVESLERATGEPPAIIANAPDAASWRPDLVVVPDVLPSPMSQPR